MVGNSRAILVTGCSSGIGAHCAKRLREDGWRVLVTARKEADIARLQAEGFEVFYLECHDPASIKTCFNAALKATGGKLDAIFNNAGYSQAGAVEDIPIEALREQFEVNFFSIHAMTLLAVEHMRAQGYGRIIQHSSVLGFCPMILRGAYNASKYALEGLYGTMHTELQGCDIHVSLLQTGPIPSNVAINALPYLRKYIDVENSHYQEIYRPRIAELEAGGTADTTGTGAEPVYIKLKRALNDKSPRPQYFVTRQTYLAGMLKRLLPSRLFFKAINYWS